jgi:hypothetical protein
MLDPETRRKAAVLRQPDLVGHRRAHRRTAMVEPRCAGSLSRPVGGMRGRWMVRSGDLGERSCGR